MCMILVLDMVLVLQKIKQVKTRVDLKGKIDGSTKWNFVGCKPPMPGLQLDVVTPDSHLI